MLHDLANDGGFVALKRAAEDRRGRRHRERMSKTCCTAQDYWSEMKFMPIYCRTVYIIWSAMEPSR